MENQEKAKISLSIRQEKVKKVAFLDSTMFPLMAATEERERERDTERETERERERERPREERRVRQASPDPEIHVLPGTFGQNQGRDFG